MPRAIKPDDPKINKLLKLMPSEVVMAYLTIHGIVRTSLPAETAGVLDDILLWASAVALTVICPIWLCKMSGVKRVVHLVLATIAFWIWLVCTGGPLELYTDKGTLIGAILLPIWSIVLALTGVGAEES